MSTLSTSVLLLVATTVFAGASAEELHVYGPGGPAPAYKAAAAQFEARTGLQVKVVAGLTPSWIDAAKADGDVIFSGSEHMMTDFAMALGEQIQPADVEPLYIRPMAIIVRAGNPKHIHGFEDLMKPGVKLEVVNGSGLTGAWEDMAGRYGRMDHIRALRKNIAAYGKNSADAKQIWTDHPELDAWLTWTVWQSAYKQIGEVIPVDAKYALYRDTGVVLTQRGKANPVAAKFLAFLKSDEGAKIFVSSGWSAPTPGQ